MKTIIAGSRNINDYSVILKAIISSGFDITEIVSGGARGVDSLGEQFSKDTDIPSVIFSADWDKHGKSAGYKRNIVMANYADALIAIWDGESSGTKHMISAAKNKGLKVFVYYMKENK